MPVTCIANGEGPSVLFTGANHGDEYEGPVSLVKLLRELDPATLQGRVIILPFLNYPAFLLKTSTQWYLAISTMKLYPDGCVFDWNKTWRTT